MAIVRTGRGPRHTRDIGPAGPGVSTLPLSGFGRISALGVRGGSRSLEDGEAQPGGAGEIERRQITSDEIAAREARDAARAPRFDTRPTRGAQATFAPREEEPVPTPAIPCGSCLHEAVCRLKSELPNDPEAIFEPHVIAPGLRLVFADARVECDHYIFGLGRQPQPSSNLGSETATRVIRAVEPKPHAPHRSKATKAEKRARARLVADAMARLGDVDKVAAELGMRRNAVTMVLRFAEQNAGAAS